MSRTLLDLVTKFCIEVDEDLTDDFAVANIKSFINTIYKDIAKKEGLEKSVDVLATNYLVAIPSDYYKVSKITYGNEIVGYEEESGNLKVDINGNLKLYYFYIPNDLNDNDTFLTNPANDDLILAGAKYLYYHNSNQDNKAEIYNRDYNTQPVRRICKKVQFKVVR